MEQCIVCLNSNQDILSRIIFQSREWLECNIQGIIEQHLWWWHLKKSTSKDTALQWICRQCWLELSTFHTFYLRVEKAHNEVVKTIDIAPIQVKIEQESSAFEPSCSNFQTEEELIMDIKVEDPLSEVDNDFKDYANFNHFTIREVDDADPETNWDPRCVKMSTGSKITKTSTVLNKSKTSLAGIQKVPTKVATKTKPQAEVCEEEIFKEADYQLRCDICQVLQTDFRTLKSHFRKEHEINGYAVCCGYQFTKRCHLIRHFKVHKNLKCPICNQSFKSLFALKEHDEACKELFKETEFKLECSICKEPQANFRDLNIHFIKEHNTHAISICCGKKFTSRSHLMDHLNVHRNSNYFHCQICNKSYSSRRCLKKHLNVVHAVKDEKKENKKFSIDMKQNLDAAADACEDLPQGET